MKELNVALETTIGFALGILRSQGYSKADLRDIVEKSLLSMPGDE